MFQGSTNPLTLTHGSAKPSLSSNELIINRQCIRAQKIHQCQHAARPSHQHQCAARQIHHYQWTNLTKRAEKCDHYQHHQQKSPIIKKSKSCIQHVTNHTHSSQCGSAQLSPSAHELSHHSHEVIDISCNIINDQQKTSEGIVHFAHHHISTCP